MKPLIRKVMAREILDSRGNPTVEATVVLTDGGVGVAAVPAGASTGSFEAFEKRDGEKNRYRGLGVRHAVESVTRVIAPALAGIPANEQYEIDRILCQLDGTKEKKNLGANALLSVSLATARACANFYRMPLFRYLGGISAHSLPIPMMNVLNGGAHASNNIDIQEFMILPVGAPNFKEALRWGSEIYHELGALLKSSGHAVSVGDEGGYAPDLCSDEEALDYLVEAIEKAGYTADQVKIGLDAAAGEWQNEDGYRQPKRKRDLTREELISYWSTLCGQYPIVSLEDGLSEDDFEGWHILTEKLGSRVLLVGDDLFVTSSQRILTGVKAGAANAVLIKPNQAGTLSETMQAVQAATSAGYRPVLSHRSGETEDTTVADLAVAVDAPLIKAGAPCRGERVAKYNRLLRIDYALGKNAVFGSPFLPF